MTTDFLSRDLYRCRFDWGLQGTLRAVSRGDIVVLVDVLSFSTATALAVSRGAQVFPCAKTDDASAIALRIGGEAAVERTQVPASGRYSLSPLSLMVARKGERIVIPSLNGATCSQSASHALTFAAALVNAGVSAKAVTRVMSGSESSVTIIACGEREKDSTNSDLRMALEDYLGAGAIIAALDCTKSPEALVAENAFCSSSADLSALIWESVSGRELRAVGFGEDVRFAAEVDSVNVVPVLRDGYFVEMEA